jgi:hypothetical protein
MKLKELRIELQPSYADNAGKYEGKFEYEGKDGNITMILDAAISEALLLCISEVLTKFASAAARQVEQSLIQSVQEARKTPVIEA